MARALNPPLPFGKTESLQRPLRAAVEHKHPMINPNEIGALMKRQFVQKNLKSPRNYHTPLQPDRQLDAQGDVSATGIIGRKTLQRRSVGCFGALRARLNGWRGRRWLSALLAAFMAVTGNIGAIEASQQTIPDVQLIQGASPDQLFGPDAETSPILLSLNCVFRESMLLGIPSSGGRDPVFNSTMDVQSDGVVFVNGLPIEPIYKGSTDDGHLWYTMVSVIHVGIATHGAVTDGMMMPDVSDSDVAVIAQIQAGMYAMILGDRRRMMAIDLVEEIVMFVDESENGWINRFNARCR